MASLLSILKNVINLNRVHVEKQEIVTVPVPRFGGIYNEKQVHIYLRPIRRSKASALSAGRNAPAMIAKATRKAGGGHPT